VPCLIKVPTANTVAWVANNVEGSYKRSVTMAMMVSFGNLNGAVTSNVYRGKDKPWYRLGHGITLAYIGIGLVTSILFKILLVRENRKRDRGERNENIAEVNIEVNQFDNLKYTC
jgi:plastocyanin domain-containing protein